MSHNVLSVWSFYSFATIADPAMLLPKLLLVGKKKSIKGTILLAKEGFNCSICATDENAKLLFDTLVSLVGAKEINLKINPCSLPAFSRFKVKIKKEIVTIGISDLEVEKLKGQYIKPADWDKFISQKDVVVIDTRNNYEVDMGTFAGSINPQIETFRQLPGWLKDNWGKIADKKVAMFCTGGIRCEKSTSYLKQMGHDQVYHLEGGILQYLEDTNNPTSQWQGDCFVFDDRSFVDAKLKDPRT
jgi:UPF0176 protein